MASPVQSHKVKINLLHPQGISDQPLRSVWQWFLDYGKYIIVIVELFVIGTFLTQFKLDADLNNLKNAINNEIAVIERDHEKEGIIRTTHYKLTEIKRHYDTNPDWSAILNAFSSQVPQPVVFKSLNIDHTAPTKSSDFRLTGKSETNNDLGLFVSGIKRQTKEEKLLFKDVGISNISLDQEALLFGLSGATNE